MNGGTHKLLFLLIKILNSAINYSCLIIITNYVFHH